MDTFKDIKVKIDDTESALAALETALSVARKFTAHLDVFHIRPQPSCLVPVPVVSSDIAGFVVNEVVTADERAADEAADKTRAAFGEFVKNHGLCPTDAPRKNIGEVSAEYREFDGAEAEMTAWCARAADLMVLPRPAENNPDNALEIVNAAVMEGGSAVLLAPQTKIRPSANASRFCGTVPKKRPKPSLTRCRFWCVRRKSSSSKRKCLWRKSRARRSLPNVWRGTKSTRKS